MSISSSEQRFGEFAVKLGFLTTQQMVQELETRAREAPIVPLQAWLTKRGRLTAAQCTEIARAFRDATPKPRQIGRYLLLEELGRGGMGTVWRARDTILQRDVALKTIQVADAPPVMIERFLREARTAAQLEHPGIVPIHDVGVDQGTPYFAMALIRGQSLDELWKEGKPADRDERIRILLAIARAIAHAHERRVIHRDLKPSNILIDTEGKVHVMDLGLAKSLDDSGQLTGTSEVFGTPRYLAPEQLNGVKENSGPGSDVYSMGVMLYEALTGQPPFADRNLAVLLSRILKGESAAPRTLDPSIPEELERICLKAMSREVANRHPSAGELAADLQAFLDGAAPPTPAGPPATEASTPPREGTIARWMRRLGGDAGEKT